MNGYLRVTDILFPFSGLKNIDPVILQNAADRGTLVHEICTGIMENLGCFHENIDEKIIGYVNSFLTWSEKDFIKRPDRFYCDKLMLTGECDGIYKDGDDLVLFDLKTSANESKTWRLQGSAYTYLAKECGIDIKRIEFIKLSKEGKPPKIYCYEYDFEMFMKCYDVYKYFFKPGNVENPLDNI